eukprot:TRINITY_DN14796_c0_g1_i1.p1 TRINITY_DN14796_c0_g1~~TRINITY_DN14796_c0_g1_i1.p1  ORF type:complete len:206 (+),score=60.31 TRINITY_DN14796_c0_g1_i1:30-647(+)
MKKVYLVRHGESEHNAICGTPEVDEDNDPFLFDSCLSKLGREQVADLTARVKASELKPDLIVSSPLSRALETAQAFSHFTGVPFVVHPWARERVDTACDLGTPTPLLKEKWSTVFPTADFSLLSEDLWFYAPNSDTNLSNYQEQFKQEAWKEPFELVQERIAQLKEWIKNHEAKEIVVVGHSAYFKEWLNAPSKMPNCHIHETTL